MEIGKDEKIKKETSKYKKLFKTIGPDKQPFAEKLYTRAAFMAATLDELQEQINKDGPVITLINGNGFETTSEHPAQKSYNQMIRNYNSTIKALCDMLPESNGKSEGDELEKFLARGKK